ncbi:hypothetical protein CWW57_RS15470 [Vibrio parahaemolyticus]|uniref:hypothetical protein n=1 Tax=Vibrio parahaemolyticus TaxID=670 RepID=UPI000B781705|nr:hypothetical protein [Vibrio parahaemolyticus]EGQ8137205.1 hypothetical protein [Vibrio parahaemolyticus]EGQ8150527.1 hypothetical protein [Vibrio parahaemolyticus]EGQ8251910.1 hypothetical protein [Vibrio parahaemolyticus]EGQ8266516.1 hypothetical protein [Vibrio parahaemolyticus]EGQ8271812.1 hypothetical protein [Vibrio parahaemolyticus]
MQVEQIQDGIDSLSEQKIRGAFDNPKFTWRTLRGISNETGIPVEQIKVYVYKYSDDILAASTMNTKGESLYTTRKKYRNRTSLARRIVAAIKNRAD